VQVTLPGYLLSSLQRLFLSAWPVVKPGTRSVMRHWLWSREVSWGSELLKGLTAGGSVGILSGVCQAGSGPVGNTVPVTR